MWAWCTSPVIASMIGTVSPAQSTNSLSPATCVCRIVGEKALSPFAVKLTKTRIAVTVPNFRAMLLPQDHPCHATPFQLLVHLGPIRSLACRTVMKPCRCEQPPLQFRVADLRQWPRDADHLGTGHELAYRRFTDTSCLAHLTDAEPELVRQTKHLANLSHRHSHLWHRLPRCFC